MSTQESSYVAGLQFARAMAAFAMMIVLGYAFSTTPVESANEPVLPVAASQPDLAPTTYFPAQYTNQGAGNEEHIQAF